MKKVIIIGAGPAGLTAGYELVKDNNEEYEVVILEETNEIGNISNINFVYWKYCLFQYDRSKK